mgnify:CR=1 FL=1
MKKLVKRKRKAAKVLCYMNEVAQCGCSFNGCVAQCHC